MAHERLTDEQGNTLYFYQPVEEGIQFEIEYETPGNNSGDVEIIFVVPTREFPKIYDKYEIDPSVPIEKAIALISGLGLGSELANYLVTDIERINQFAWYSFDD